VIPRALVPAVCVGMLALSAAFAANGATAAPASAWAESEHVAVRAISAADAVGGSGRVQLGLEFRMDPGWHIYWRSPGDAGYPPRADWSESVNLASAELSWPSPERITVLDLQTIGYSDRVVLPVAVRLRQPEEPLAVRATVDYLACADICVPHVAVLALDLPAGPATPSAFAADIARAGEAVPGAGPGGDITVEEAVLTGTPQRPELRVAIRSTAPLDAPDVFVEAEPPLAFGAPTRTLSPDGRLAVLRMPVVDAGEVGRPPLGGLAATLTVVDGDRGIERRTVLRQETAPAQPIGDGTRGLAAILALAVLGGLILNLMPCVLPVLSIKLLAVVGHGGGDRRVVRAGFVATAAGIGFSFLVLAGALVVLQAGGAAIGWGLQFQQPWFLTAMILVVTLFACNLWGLFEVPLPRAIGIADEHAGRVRGLGGHFLTGALATLLATPCSAPFLGTAVGFALARGPTDIFAVFGAVGFGLALPYLAVAAVPGLATRLPRPGRWMATLRRVLGYALFGTAIWLTWVLAGRTGVPGALLVGALAAGVVVVLSIRETLPRHLQRATGVAVLALGLAAFVLPPAPEVTRPSTAADGFWQPFDPQRIPSLVEGGATVFVNVTADWCLTCKVNERLVLAQDPVRSRLGSEGVVAMRGDWTAPDDGIARYLAGFGRYAIPFDAVYGPGTPDGVALPELLTERAVLDALDRARGNGATAGR